MPDKRPAPSRDRIQHALVTELGLQDAVAEPMSHGLLGLIQEYRAKSSAVRTTTVRDKTAKLSRMLGTLIQTMNDRDIAVVLSFSFLAKTGKNWPFKGSVGDFLNNAVALKAMIDETHEWAKDETRVQNIGTAAQHRERRRSNRSDRARARLLNRALFLGLRTGLLLKSGGTTNAGTLVRIVLREAAAPIPSGEGDRAFRRLVARHLDEATQLHRA